MNMSGFPLQGLRNMEVGMNPPTLLASVIPFYGCVPFVQISHRNDKYIAHKKECKKKVKKYKPRYAGPASNIIPPIIEAVFLSHKRTFIYFIYWQ